VTVCDRFRSTSLPSEVRTAVCLPGSVRCRGDRHGHHDGGLTGAAAISGVLVSVLADGLKDRRRTAHERMLREEDGRAAASDRRRTFELENLISAYDGLWLLTRKAAKIHLADVHAAKHTERGYGGTLLPDGPGTDLSQTSQAVKAIRLILNDQVRRLALDAHEAMGAVSMLGVRAWIFQAGPVSLAEGEAAFAEAVRKADAALPQRHEFVQLPACRIGLAAGPRPALGNVRDAHILAEEVSNLPVLRRVERSVLVGDDHVGAHLELIFLTSSGYGPDCEIILRTEQTLLQCLLDLGGRVSRVLRADCDFSKRLRG
jgi:hypothetical protein